MSRLGLLSGLVGLGIGLWVQQQPAASKPPEAPDRERVELEAMGQSAEADRLFKAGDFVGALPIYVAERASRAALGDLRYEAYALRAIGCCHFNLGDNDAALGAFLDAAKRDEGREDKGFEGYDWLLIGRARLRSGKLEESAGALRKALPLLATAIDRDHEADARLTLADVCMRLGKFKEAAAAVERAEELARLLDDSARKATTWLVSARLALAMEEPGLAAERADDARRVFLVRGAKGEMADAAYAMGEALADLDRLEAAAGVVEAASEAHRAMGGHPERAADLGLLAALKADSGDLGDAVVAARGVVEERRVEADPEGEVEALVALARYQFQAEERAGAAETLASAIEVGRRELAPARLVRLLILAADVNRLAGFSDRGTGLLDEAERVAGRAKNGALRRMVTEAREGAGRR